ncbi:NUDIX hydrolase [Alphaproteobacteria bacterium LSUCC0684]
MPKYTKAGTIPIRMKGRQIEVCFVTSRSRRAVFVLPKGTIGKTEKASETALRETYEEAGVKGRILWPWKNGKRKKSIKAKTREYRAKYFILLVDTIHNQWPERPCRNRKWLNAMALRRKNTTKRDRDVIRSMLKLNLKDAISKAVASSSAA